MMSCDLHDYLEIACMFKYKVTVICRNSDEACGTAIDLTVDQNHGECLVLDTSEELKKLPLASLATMRVLTSNARFECISFE